MNEVMREEKKYALDVAEGAVLRTRLAQVMHADAHNGARGYSIRSLYFDTLDDQDFWDKIEGIELRRKIRLRIYSPADTVAKLEMKQKQGPYQKKRSLAISRADALALCAGDYSPLLRYSDPFAAECYGLMHNRCYRPRTIVEYRRQAFIARENNIRLTFDSDIRATEASMALFAEDLALTPVLDPFSMVLEVKFNGFLLAISKICWTRCTGRSCR